MNEFERRINEHLEKLIANWEDKPDPVKQKIARYYIDAYRCIQHNILKEDVAGFKEAQKNFPIYPKPLRQEHYSKDKWIAMLDDWDSEVQKWKSKWVDDEK